MFMGIIRSHGLLWLSWTVTSFHATVCWGVNPPKPFSRSPYLQSAAPTQIHVLWRTEGPIEPEVRYGEEVGQLTDRVRGGSITTRASLGTNGQEILPQWKALRTSANLSLPKLHSAPVGTFQYEAKISDLKPDTTYYYAVYDGDKRLTPQDPSYRWTTHPLPGSGHAARFWVLGDGGTGREPQSAVYKAMLQTLEKESRPLDFWIHVGDMAYGVGRDTEFQTRFFESYETTLRNKVCWPTMGNHEGHTSNGKTGVGPYYDAYLVPKRAEAGGLASGTEAYYSFDFAHLHFICLNSHDLDRKPTEPMAKWLKADLEKTKADWLIAFWHHPPYTKGSHDSDKEKDLIEMRRFIMPIVEAGGVDVVFTGHSHTYERSMLMDGAYGTNTVAEGFILDDGDGDPAGDGAYRKSAGIHAHEGTVQVVTGNAGQTLGRNGTLPVMRKVILEHGSVIVDVLGETLVARMINRNGTEKDLFSIVKRSKVVPTRLALPWQPPEYKKPTTETKVKASPAVDHHTLIAKGATWNYILEKHQPSMEWTRLGFKAEGWKIGPAGFGYGDGSYSTHLKEMRRHFSTLYVRREFTVEQADRVTELGLLIDYKDGFIAYLNGQEVARVGVGRSSGRNAQSIKSREDHGTLYSALKDAHKILRDGVNLLAIEAHNTSADEPDFLLDPVLVVED